ncbi:glycosyl transferase family 4 [archaeon]|jgi:UDP-N-acetylglucosamine--dolichyl-phosphate N-acetylglucosaminephosphotransferase|nr:glycosyl transferase family 4 [archaeon]
MDPIILIAILISFFCTYLVLPTWIRKAKENKMTAKDMHKINEERVAEVGGISVLIGLSIGILIYVGIQTFYIGNTSNLIEIFALLSVLFISSMIGLTDDLLGWKKGLNKKIRLILMIFAAIPLMVINAGESVMSLPLLGTINFGIFYPLLLIPLGIVATTTAFNIIAGYNGLETSQGILILSGLGLATYFTGNAWLSVICAFAVASLIAFYIFNKHPAKVFPGDTLTYSVGALIGTIAIMGNIEKAAIIFFIPYILEVFLKARGKLVKESFAKLNEDGSLEVPYEKFYGIEHIAIAVLKKIKPGKKVYEKEVVYAINLFQIIFIVLGLLTLL